MQPIALKANQPRARFYRGGRRIAAFRGLDAFVDYTPEDWVGSTTAVAGSSPVGLTVLEDGSLLADRIAADPEVWLGPRHHAAWGSDTQLLVKLLDAGQRLPIHAHPDDAFAATHLGARHGKAEAWYILEPGRVHLGLNADLPRKELLDLVLRQKTSGLLSAMHELEVVTGDTVFVPPGLLHAIGEGTFLLEVQQPEDLSILLEWRDFTLDGLADGHLGLGFDTATKALTLAATSEHDLGRLIRRRPGDGETLSELSSPYFRLLHVSAGGPAAEQAAGFAIAVAHAGEAVLMAVDGTPCRLGAGSTTLIPFSYGDYVVATGSLLLARPPLR